jgi:hypothetical protein
VRLVSGATTVLTLTEASEQFPQYRVVNATAATISVQQRDDSRALIVPPGQSAPFAWHEPAAPLERRVVLVSIEHYARTVVRAAGAPALAALSDQAQVVAQHGGRDARRRADAHAAGAPHGRL